MSAMGLGGFMQGFSQGLTSTVGAVNAIQKGKREQEEAEFQRQQRELEVKVRDETAQALAALQKSYENPMPAEDGSEPVRMSAPEFFYEQQKVLAGAAQRLGKFDSNAIENMRRGFEGVRFENLREAMNYGWARPGDREGVAKRLKKAGIDLPEGMMFKKEAIDPNDPQAGEDLVGFRITPEGKEVREFSFMNAIPMVASAEVMLKDFLQTKSETRGIRAKAREGALDRANRVDLQLLENAGRDSASGNKKDPQKELRDVLEGRFKAQLSNPSNAYQSAAVERFRNKVSRAAEAAVGRGYGVYESIDAAFERYKDEDPSIFKKTK
jgi:DNA gyrase/topoisomerase IV subunit A